MAEAKTKPTGVSVETYLTTIEDRQRREDCQALVTLMRDLTHYEPTMWGPSIVGFGQYHYRYASGHEGDSCLVGFASRKADISIYITAGSEGRELLLSQLGKHKTAKACLYVKRLADIDLNVLRKLIAESVADMKRRYPASK